LPLRDLIIHAAIEYSGVELEHITAEKAGEALRAQVSALPGCSR